MKFFYKRIIQAPTGFAMGVRIKNLGCGLWIGYGQPIWWIPRIINKKTSVIPHNDTIMVFGLGWLLLCFQIQIWKFCNN